MSLSIEELRRNYAHLSEEQLTRIAMDEASGLTPEGLEALRQELASRGLLARAEKSFEARATPLTEERLQAYCDAVRSVACPACGSRTRPLNATIVSTTMSFIFFSQRTERAFVACPDCLDKKNNGALAKTAVLGWWGFPWGILYSIGSIRKNVKMRKAHHLGSANDVLRAYVSQRMGRIAALEGSPQELQGYLQGENASYA